MNLANFVNNPKVVLTLQILSTDMTLLTEVQTQLSALGLYLGRIDGLYGRKSDAAIADFCDILNLPKLGSSNFNSQQFAVDLLNLEKSIPAILERAKDRNRIFYRFKTIQDDMFANQQADDLHFAFLDRGIFEIKPGDMPNLPRRSIPESPCKKEIPNYPTYLQRKPDKTSLLPHPTTSRKFSNYPNRNQLPVIENDGLSFLSSDVSHACVCIGSFNDKSELVVRWLGRNAVEPMQFWSATKFIPILNLVCQANQENSKVLIGDCNVRGSAENTGFKFTDLVVDMVSYRNGVDRSNQIATMFKRFKTTPYPNLETWVMQISNNRGVQFQGSYTASGPLRIYPSLFSRSTGEVLVEFQDPNSGNNYLSAYDLVRFISMLGWHNYLPASAQLPGAQWHSLSTVAQTMGSDTARYVDVAWEALGLKKFISCPVVISKLGLGTTGKGEDALAYVAFVHFCDDRLKQSNKISKLRTLAMALRIPTSLAKSAEHDARMAAEVTEILRRVIVEEIV